MEFKKGNYFQGVGGEKVKGKGNTFELIDPKGEAMEFEKLPD